MARLLHIISPDNRLSAADRSDAEHCSGWRVSATDSLWEET